MFFFMFIDVLYIVYKQLSFTQSKPGRNLAENSNDQISNHRIWERFVWPLFGIFTGLDTFNFDADLMTLLKKWIRIQSVKKMDPDPVCEKNGSGPVCEKNGSGSSL